jgi:5-methyltetrahydropteroyltriglutamate--homocysteine methyltransferase
VKRSVYFILDQTSDEGHMSKSETAPYRVDHVGSLLRPRRLLDARATSDASSPERKREIEDECIREVVALQRDVGLTAVTDGEFRRSSWRSSFDGTVLGLNQRPAQAVVNSSGQIDMGSFVMDASPFTDSRLKRVGGIVTDEFQFLTSVTDVPKKIALPAPSFLHFFRGADAINRDVYPDLSTYFLDVARIYIEEIKALEALGARYIQLDEVGIAMTSDAGVSSRMQKAGINPFDLIDLYTSLLNTVIASKGPDTVIAVHFCRGNSHGKSGGSGSFEPIAERVFGQVKADGLFIEFDGPEEQDFAPLRYVKNDKRVVLGLISTKTPVLEDPNEIKRRIDQAAKYIPLERLCLSPQCGFSSRETGTSLTIADQIDKLKLAVSIAQSVWG